MISKTRYEFPLEFPYPFGFPQQRKFILFITNPADIAGNEVIEKTFNIMGKYRLKIVLMDDNTEALFCEKGLKGIKRCHNASYEVKTYDFATDAERKAYLRGVDDMAVGCWTQTGVLEESHIRSIEEIRHILIGKTYTSYSSFNGSHTQFVIADVKKDGKVFKIFNRDKSVNDYIETDVMEILLEKGYHKKPMTIEGCHVFEEWKITPFTEKTGI